MRSLKSPKGNLPRAMLEDCRSTFRVLFFYPKDSTPGCTLEGQEFTKLQKSFERLGATVFGVSRDTVESHVRFQDKCSIQVPLISDPDEVLCKAFDVIHEKNMYGKKVLGVVRSTFVVDAEGVVVAEWRKVKAEGHATEVLDKIRELAT